jgi:hypothetical protein
MFCEKYRSKRSKKPQKAIPFSTKDYLELVNWLGHAILPTKRGYIAAETPPILTWLNLQSDGFVELMNRKDGLPQLRVIGSPSAITHYKEVLERNLIKLLSTSQRLYTCN